MIAHNGSGLESYVALNNLLQWATVTSLNKKATGIFSIEIFNCYVDENKKFLNMCILDVEEFIIVVLQEKEVQATNYNLFC